MYQNFHPFSGILRYMNMPFSLFIHQLTHCFCFVSCCYPEQKLKCPQGWSRSPGPLRPQPLWPHTTHIPNRHWTDQLLQRLQRRTVVSLIPETDKLMTFGDWHFSVSLSALEKRTHVVRKRWSLVLGQGGEKGKREKGLPLNQLCCKQVKLSCIVCVLENKEILPKQEWSLTVTGVISEIQEGSWINHQEKQVHFSHSMSSYPLSWIESSPPHSARCPCPYP